MVDKRGLRVNRRVFGVATKGLGRKEGGRREQRKGKGEGKWVLFNGEPRDNGFAVSDADTINPEWISGKEEARNANETGKRYIATDWYARKIRDSSGKAEKKRKKNPINNRNILLVKPIAV